MGAQTESKKPFYEKWWVITLVATLVIVTIAMVPSLDGSVDSQNVGREKENATDENVPQEYKKALKSAQNYLDMSGFSRRNLKVQLEFEGFSDDSVEYALDNLDVDWNEQALRSARVYYNDMSMSKEEVFTQLSSDGGEGYTREQAQYAVDNLN